MPEVEHTPPEKSKQHHADWEPKVITNLLETNPKNEVLQDLEKSWGRRDGEFSEVLDSEGHRVRINRY